MFAATNVKKLKYKEYILAAFVTVTAINIVPSVLESVGAWPYYAYFGAGSHEENKWVYGLTQNSNFYAGISTVFTACCNSVSRCYSKNKCDYDHNKIKKNCYHCVIALDIVACKMYRLI